MSFFPGKDPKAGDAYACDADRRRGGAAHRRSRRLRGAARAAVGAHAHGRAVHLLRPFRAGRIPRRARPRRAAASAYRACHRHLSVRRRDHAPRQPRHRGRDQAGRGELDDRRPRHRAFRAHRRREARRRRADPRLADVGGAARPPKRRWTPALRITPPPNSPWSRKTASRCAWWSARSTARRSPVPTVHETMFADVHLKAGSAICRSTPATRSARFM